MCYYCVIKLFFGNQKVHTCDIARNKPFDLATTRSYSHFALFNWPSILFQPPTIRLHPIAPGPQPYLPVWFQSKPGLVSIMT